MKIIREEYSFDTSKIKGGITDATLIMGKKGYIEYTDSKGNKKILRGKNVSSKQRKKVIKSAHAR